MSASINIGIDYRGYQRIESNNPPDIKFSTIIKILDYYKVSFEDLIK